MTPTATSPAQREQTERATSAPTFRWRAHPAREHGGRAVAAGGVVLALAALCAVLMQSAWWAALAGLVLVLALNRFFLPSRFSIDDEGITARYPLRRIRYRWVDLRRFAVDRNGGYLSTRARPSWLDGYQGMHVLFGTERDSVVGRIRDHLRRGGGPWAS